MTSLTPRAVPSRAAISVFPHGIETTAPRAVGAFPHAFSKRGKICGWSAHSRLRLRRFMLEHGAAQDAYEYNVTLTVPGPPLTVPEMRKLWHEFSRLLERAGRSAVWRLEVQKRGSVHWHLILTTPKEKVGFLPKMGRPSKRPVSLPPILEREMVIAPLWRKALDTLGPCKYRCCDWTTGEKDTFTFQSRADIPFAFHVPQWAKLSDSRERAVDASMTPPGEEEWAWRRYMYDHTSKAKQEQIAEGFGRHWGVVGRSGFARILPEAFQGLSDARFWSVLRALQRLVSGREKSAACPFGSRRRRRSRRGSHGVSVWFIPPGVTDRLRAWALTLPD